jgi:MFS superfamily sulfate permease-like transporter
VDENMTLAADVSWEVDWLWSLPLIVLSVVIHVVGLMLIYREVVRIMNMAVLRRRFFPMFIVVMGLVALLATVLHGLEGTLWAIAYLLLDALPDSKSAMLYSLSAMTSYGHANLFLKEHWQLMGALEALNGTLLFGLTTAFLFAMIREVWDIEKKHLQRIDGMLGKN